MGQILARVLQKKNQASRTPQTRSDGSWSVRGGTDLRVVVCGSGAVGKSAFTIQFVQNHFVEEYDPSIEDHYRKQLLIDNEVAMLDILDTAGQEEFSAMRDQWFRSGEGFVIMYSITDRRSFDEVEMIHKRIQNAKDAIKGPMVIIGNKCDLEADRQVTTLEGRELAKCLGVPFFETSSKLPLNVDEAFMELVREMRRYANNVK